MKINDIGKSTKTILPVNRVLFPDNKQQKRFIRGIFIVAIIAIIHFWVLDIYRFTTGTLVIDSLFWFRQISAVMVFLHIIALIINVEKLIGIVFVINFYECKHYLSCFIY